MVARKTSNLEALGSSPSWSAKPVFPNREITFLNFVLFDHLKQKRVVVVLWFVGSSFLPDRIFQL